VATLAGLQPWLRPWATALLLQARREGLAVVLASTRRSWSTQSRLYRRYLLNKRLDPGGEGIRYLPAARPGTSLHQVGRAFDLNGDSRALTRLGAIWKSWGGTYGGAFNDPVHFEA
jgi:LAS superfamily LD-carboxypeptidase LdcB